LIFHPSRVVKTPRSLRNLRKPGKKPQAQNSQ
jgi:hypothetical protein